MLALADDADCAAIMRQTIDGTDAAAIVRRLEIDEFREMLDITYTALESELKDTPGPAAPTSADMEAASFALARRRRRTERSWSSGRPSRTLPPRTQRSARAARNFVGAILDLEEPHRATFLRYMVVQGRVICHRKETLAKKSLRW